VIIRVREKKRMESQKAEIVRSDRAEMGCDHEKMGNAQSCATGKLMIIRVEALDAQFTSSATHSQIE
jgi:hypothetical protein